MLVQKASAACVFINIRQHKSRAQLAADFFVQCAKTARRSPDPSLPGTAPRLSGVIRQRVFDNRLVLVEKDS